MDLVELRLRNVQSHGACAVDTCENGIREQPDDKNPPVPRGIGEYLRLFCDTRYLARDDQLAQLQYRIARGRHVNHFASELRVKSTKLRLELGFPVRMRRKWDVERAR